jgi:two-component system response regulator GlrR
MQELLGRARLVASGDSSVLITGETGTGKEVLARAIHDGGPRRAAPFVGINCSALPEQLLESELFGHEKGAFTGAVARHQGLFQAAHQGTLFLDEIGDMPLPLQAKLLRVLQDFRVRPVGSVRSVSVDVRTISATHRDLEDMVAKGEFRADLYYRLNVVPLRVPSLRERREDIPLLVEHFLDTLARRQGRAKKRLAPEAMQCLAAAALPGNIRQLQNVVEQCTVLSTSEVIPPGLVAEALRDQPGGILPLDEAKLAFERRYLVGVLRTTEGKVAAAARLAGRNRTEFYKLLQRHGLDPARFRPSLSSRDDS